jgi:hypothetical protein
MCGMLLSAVGLVVFFSTGCQKSAVLGPDSQNSDVSNENVALSVAGLIGEHGGGVVDQVGDALVMVTNEGPQMLGKAIDDAQGICSRTAVYDSINQIWTINVSRERGAPGDSVYGKFERTFTLQFFNKEGLPQKRWITKGDTAYSFDFNIISGTGFHIKPKMHHYLKSISGGWIGTNANTDLITINGTYQRAAIDTIFRDDAKRISDHSVNLSLNDVTGPRGSRRDLSQKVSGSITGVFQAMITVVLDDTTLVRHVERDINIQLGNGEADIRVNNEKFRGDAGSGRLLGR